MFFLILGLVIFLGLHSIRIFAEDWRSNELALHGEPAYKGNFANGRFENVDVVSNQRVIHYCGGGIATTSTTFALEMLGVSDSAVYDHSLLEWTTRAAAPIKANQQ
jgi:3-mercaptopyruvate sulfurtransferase SseA